VAGIAIGLSPSSSLQFSHSLSPFRPRFLKLMIGRAGSCVPKLAKGQQAVGVSRRRSLCVKRSGNRSRTWCVSSRS
jgi:hypothetical protein